METMLIADVGRWIRDPKVEESKVVAEKVGLLREEACWRTVKTKVLFARRVVH